MSYVRYCTAWFPHHFHRLLVDSTRTLNAKVLLELSKETKNTTRYNSIRRTTRRQTLALCVKHWASVHH